MHGHNGLKEPAGQGIVQPSTKSLGPSPDPVSYGRRGGYSRPGGRDPEGSVPDTTFSEFTEQRLEVGAGPAARPPPLPQGLGDVEG